MEIYLDNAATTELEEEVIEAMISSLKNNYANPSSVYRPSQNAKKELEYARDKIAKMLGAKSKEIFFTSGGTESDNWAIKGAAFKKGNTKKHIITTPIEHHAVINSVEYLKNFGFEVSYVKVTDEGFVDIEDLKSLIRKDTLLCSVMYANNEIGTIQDINKIGQILKENDVLFHVDGVQALDTIEIDLSNLNVDLMSFASHKVRGPKGIGLLYIKDGVTIENFMHGGAQERSKRSGTENLAGVVGFCKALEISRSNLKERTAYIQKLRDKLIENLLEIDGVVLNGPVKDRLVSNVNVSIEDVDTQILLMMLDKENIYASSASACTANSIEPSHVLLSIGRNESMAKNCLRLTLSEKNSIDEIEMVSVIIKDKIRTLRG